MRCAAAHSGKPYGSGCSWQDAFRQDLRFTAAQMSLTDIN